MNESKPDNRIRISAKTPALMNLLTAGVGLPDEVVARHVTQSQDGRYSLDIDWPDPNGDPDICKINTGQMEDAELSALKTCQARYAVIDAVKAEVEKLQAERDSIDQAIEALKTHVLGEGPGSIPF